MEIKNILRVLLGTGILLLIPLAIQLTIGTGIDGQGWNWTLSDFIIIGSIIFIAGLALDLAWRKLGKYRAIGAIAIVILFLWLWAELAVGVFTNWGS